MTDRLARDSLVGMTAALLVWSAYFVAMYALLSVGCVARLDQARVLGANAVVLALAVMTIAALAAIAYLGWRGVHARRAESARAGAAGHRPFIAGLAALCAGVALVATAWVAAPMFLLPPCA